MSNDYNKIIISAKFIDKNKTILRYIDLEECNIFIEYINRKKLYKIYYF